MSLIAMCVPGLTIHKSDCQLPDAWNQTVCWITISCSSESHSVYADEFQFWLPLYSSVLENNISVQINSSVKWQWCRCRGRSSPRTVLTLAYNLLSRTPPPWEHCGVQPGIQMKPKWVNLLCKTVYIPNESFLCEISPGLTLQMY